MTDIQSITETLAALIGDVPVSVQIDTALRYKASIDHKHDDYASRDEVEDLKRKIEMLMSLVGDIPISSQIAEAINNIKK